MASSCNESFIPHRQALLRATACLLRSKYVYMRYSSNVPIWLRIEGTMLADRVFMFIP